MGRDSRNINGFDKPTDLPKDHAQHQQWQEQNRDWWEKHPMRYDWNDPVGFEEFSTEFFQEIDQRFFSVVREYMPWKKIPFDPLINFGSLNQRDVLEIGVGNGSHAQLLAQHAKSYTGIDITSYALKSTSERMKHFGLDKAKIIRMDAENMEFPDDSFDYIWTWGVIDHSANTQRIVEEMARVLRPSVRAVTMVYHRSWWNYYVIGGIFLGIFRGGLFRTGSLHKTVQESTDGAFSRYYTPREWRNLVSSSFDARRIQVYGAKAELLPIPGGKFKSTLMRAMPDSLCRFLTNHCGMGSFLVSILQSKK